jgi:hypothetical protein
VIQGRGPRAAGCDLSIVRCLGACACAGRSGRDQSVHERTYFVLAQSFGRLSVLRYYVPTVTSYFPKPSINSIATYNNNRPIQLVDRRHGPFLYAKACSTVHEHNAPCESPCDAASLDLIFTVLLLSRAYAPRIADIDPERPPLFIPGS